VEQVEIRGLRIAYERAGGGPPLLLLQGFVGDARSTWRRQIDDLSDEFTVVAWDVPGAGRSSDPPESFRLPDYADSLAGFVDTLGLGRVHLVGLSFGGALSVGHALHAAIPNSNLVVMPGVGHVNSVEAAEQFNLEVRRFLRRLDDARAQPYNSRPT
jgi:pimeloyl-ACP methyl ester carboxylesterase